MGANVFIDGNNFEIVPANLVTQELCNLAAKYDPLCVYYMPERYVTKEMWLDAVKRNGYLLSKVPKQFVDMSMCDAAIRSERTSFQHVPEKFKQELIVRYGLIDVISKELVTPTLCETATKLDPRLIESVPKQFVTDEMIHAAVKYHGHWLRYVPIERRTFEVCKMAVESDGAFTMDYVPFEHRTYEMWLAFKNRHSMAFNKIPLEFRTREMCEGVSCSSLPHIPRDILTQEMCMNVLTRNGYAIEKIPADMITQEMCVQALEHLDYGIDNGSAAVLAKHGFIHEKDGKWYLNAPYVELIKKNPHLLRHVSDPLPEDDYVQIVESDGRMLMYVPNKTYRVCLAAVTNHGMAIHDVPEAMRDKAMFIAAASVNSSVLKLVPDSLKHDIDLYVAAFTPKETYSMRILSLDQDLDKLRNAIDAKQSKDLHKEIYEGYKAS